ncbi:MAG: bifunctional lysine ketoglutarate reductase /saccharopine dehydrogenase family protein [Acidobacteriota bacterium]
MTTLGIRREDKSRWERRVPIVPADVESLHRDHGLDVIVQPSAIRTYDDDAYTAAGARVTESLDEATAIFAVKEVPIDCLLPERTYAFFAHVIKGQPYNMPLLRKLLDLRITLVDYERIADRHGHRLVKFGLEAGQAGMLDTLWALGRRLEVEGFTTPLRQIRQAYRYADLADAKAQLRAIASALEDGLAGARLAAPLVFGFTGRGSVSQGAQEIFDLLPHELVEPEELADVVASGRRDRLAKVVFDKRHLAAPREPGHEFNEAEYHQHPERFRGRLHEFLPHLTALVNGIYWTEDYPRFVTKAEIAAQWQAGQRRLRVIGDITCDIDGAIELTYKSTQPDAPVYTFDPDSGGYSDGLEAPGVVVMAVDNLPCELHRDASDHFSHALRDFVPAITAADITKPLRKLDLPPAIERAVITHRGRLMPDYRDLEHALDAAGV